MIDTQPELILGRYRLLDRIALGGTARVYRARDEQLDRDVAVKLLHPHLLPDDTSRRRMAAEARAAAGLSHPGIATVYDVDTDPEAPAIVMELVDGQPLSERLAHGPMEPREVARLGAEVGDALYHAHRRGIVHRDVKPGNILLESGSGRARLVDFGIAHSLAAGAESLTQTGTALGTPRYMAPEQMAGGKVGPRTDLWSLGAVLYQALTGRVPFDGGSPLAIASQQREGPPPMEGVEPSLASIVAACLSFEVAGRPLDAGELASALRGWLDGSAPEATTRTLPVAAPVPAAPPAKAVSATSGRGRGGVALVGLTAAGALLLALLVLPGMLAGPADRNQAGAGESNPTVTPEPTPDPMEQLRAAYLEACGKPLAADEMDEDDFAERIEKVNEEIEKCLEEAEKDRDEGEGGGPPPKDDGRGNGNEGNQGHGNGGGGRGNGD